MAVSAVETGAPVVVFDCSGMPPVVGTTTLSFALADGLAAILAMLPVAQRFMIAFAAARVENAGTPVRSTKITRSE
jgi:fructoselysine-6-P-deglycase FrlB-like protein